MTDYTAAITELDRAYRANRQVNATIAAEVKAKYAIIIADEIRMRKQEADYEFAKHLAHVKERTGMPLNVIQDHVLRTKSWDRWTYWRDLAEIAPERVQMANAREEREKEKAGYRWEICADNPVGYALVLTRNQKGEEVDEVRFTDIEPNSEGLITVYPQMQVFPEHRALGEQFNGAEKMYQFATKVARENEGDING